MSNIRDRFKKEIKKETLHRVKAEMNPEKLPDDFYETCQSTIFIGATHRIGMGE